jgi:hypothetical protein
MAKFGPGDRVRVNCPGDDDHGRRCTVTSEKTLGWYYNGEWPWPLNTRFGWHYDTDLDTTPASDPFDNGSEWFKVYTEGQLVPDYDGHERAEWSECAWQPNSVLSREGDRSMAEYCKACGAAPGEECNTASTLEVPRDCKARSREP